jgi:hypothetical protein
MDVEHTRMKVSHHSPRDTSSFETNPVSIHPAYHHIHQSSKVVSNTIMSGNQNNQQSAAGGLFSGASSLVGGVVGTTGKVVGG